MVHKPHVVLSMNSAAERSLLRFYLASSSAPNQPVEVAGRLDAYGGAKPRVLIAEPDVGESAPAAAQRLRGLFPQAMLVLILDGAGPMRVKPGTPVPDAVLVRPLTLERMDSVLAPLLLLAALPEKPRVLVVDDDPEVLHFVEQVLGKAGCDVTAVNDPRRWLARSTAPEFDLALLDVVMPEVDGLQLCLRLREAGRDDLRICMMSAVDDPETERKADLYGADEFLPKPLHVRELHALIGRTRQQPGRGVVRPVSLRAVEGGVARKAEPLAESEQELADP